MKRYRSDQFQGPTRGIGSSYRSTAEAISASQEKHAPGRKQEAAQPGTVPGQPSQPAHAQPGQAPAGIPDEDRPNEDESDIEEAEKADRYERPAP